MILAALAAYSNTWRVPFIFDDLTSVQENTSIRRFWPLTDVLFPPSGTGDTVEGRPLLNLSFALNYAISSLNVWSYHAFNLGIHVLNALLLLGIVRRTWRPHSGTTFDHCRALLLATGVALAWALHPLQTASVTYLSRRAESLAALFYLLTLYAFIRGTSRATAICEVKPSGTAGWSFLAIAACALGAATKEVIATAPLVVFLYDRTFVAGSFAAAWRNRWRVHLGLCATWVFVGVGVALSPDRGGTAGFGTGISSWHYLLTQCYALVRYLGLSTWPHPLVFDYGNGLITSASEVWWQGLVVCGLLAATITALRLRPALGFLGAAFFLLLAPSSSIIPVATQTIAEHRMYLPLAAVVVLLALALARVKHNAASMALGGLALLFAGLTFARNADYKSEVAIWRDTVAKRPTNARAFNNLGNALIRAGKAEAALPRFAEAVRLDPDSGEAHANLATALASRGELERAREHFASAVALAPDVPAIRYGFGMTLLRMRNTEAGINELRQAITLDPQNIEARFQLANALSRSGPNAEARELFHAVLALDPEHAGAHNHLGLMLGQTGDLADAVPHFEAALRSRPDYPEAHANLGNALLQLGRRGEAIPHFEAALQLRPDMRGVLEALDYARQSP